MAAPPFSPPSLRLLPSPQAGFTLIEILVAVFVLSLAVIGMATLQLATFRTTQQSALHTSALELAAEIADQIRMLAAFSDSQPEKAPLLAVDYQAKNGTEPAPPRQFCYSTSCNPAEWTAFTLYDWEQRLSTFLPSGRLVICRDDAPVDNSSHLFRWACTGNANHPIVIKIGWPPRFAENNYAPANPTTTSTTTSDAFPPVIVLAATA